MVTRHSIAEYSNIQLFKYAIQPQILLRRAFERPVWRLATGWYRAGADRTAPL